MEQDQNENDLWLVKKEEIVTKTIFLKQQHEYDKVYEKNNDNEDENDKVWENDVEIKVINNRLL